jgi:hypothetical protein
VFSAVGMGCSNWNRSVSWKWVQNRQNPKTSILANGDGDTFSLQRHFHFSTSFSSIVNLHHMPL